MKNIFCVGCIAAPEAEYCRLLRGAGYNVSTGTISQVVPALRSGEVSADLVIAECHALTIEVEELLWQLKRAVPGIPIIVLANDVTVESYLRSQALGIQEYVCRSVGDGAVLNMVRTLMREERLQ
jgi:DNA-binding NarL/FixJ family response regulator